MGLKTINANIKVGLATFAWKHFECRRKAFYDADACVGIKAGNKGKN